MAEREGFEPPVPFRVRRFSRPEPSTTRPPLRQFTGCRTLRSIRALLPSLQQAGGISGLGQQAERLGVKFHDLGEVRQKIGQAVVAGVGAIFVFYSFFLQFVV
jgi:hypothetical protein